MNSAKDEIVKVLNEGNGVLCPLEIIKSEDKRDVIFGRNREGRLWVCAL